MTHVKDEALKLALDVLESHEGNYKLDKAGAARSDKAIAAIKQALAAQRQWAGLTPEDKHKPDMGAYVYLNDDWLDGYKTGMEYAEAKLKEKNT
jgi:hypothetical protein